MDKLSLAEGRKGRGFPGLFLKEEERGLLPGVTQQYHLLGSGALWPHLVCPSDDTAWHGLTLTQTTERIWRWRELCRPSAPTHLFLSRGPQRAQSDVVVTEHDGDRPGWEASVLSVQELSPQPLLSQKAKKQAVRCMASLRGSSQHRVCTLTPPDSNQSHVQPL